MHSEAHRRSEIGYRLSGQLQHRDHQQKGRNAGFRDRVHDQQGSLRPQVQGQGNLRQELEDHEIRRIFGEKEEFKCQQQGQGNAVSVAEEEGPLRQLY